MKQFTEYEMQLNLRSSDKSAVSLASVSSNDPIMSSENWDRLGGRLEAVQRTMEVVGAGAALGRKGNAAAIASGGAALAKALADAAKAQADEARAMEARAREKRNVERQMAESVERGMREHNERMKGERGGYRDPPTKETAERMGRIA